MIRLSGVTKHYQNQTVLYNISLEIEKNAINGIIGPNGAGKSTLLKVMTGFIPYKGHVYISGKKILNFNDAKGFISFMPEKMQLYPEYYAGEFLKFFHLLKRTKDEELFNALELTNILNKKIKHLSKGWHQRLKLYLALCGDKPIAILDEPFEGFDPLQMQKIIQVIKKQKENGKTFLLSIHQLDYAKKICDNIILLNKGRVVEQGSMNKLSKQFKTDDLEQIFIKALNEHIDSKRS